MSWKLTDRTALTGAQLTTWSPTAGEFRAKIRSISSTNGQQSHHRTLVAALMVRWAAEQPPYPFTPSQRLRIAISQEA